MRAAALLVLVASCATAPQRVAEPPTNLAECMDRAQAEYDWCCSQAGPTTAQLVGGAFVYDPQQQAELQRRIQYQQSQQLQYCETRMRGRFDVCRAWFRG